MCHARVSRAIRGHRVKEDTLGRGDRFHGAWRECETTHCSAISPPPADLHELAARAGALAGRALGDLAAEHALAFAGREGAHTKGKTGELVERILGASGGSAAVDDFPDLGVELTRSRSMRSSVRAS